MKGLILKDLLAFKNTMTAMIFIMICYFFLGIYGNNSVMFTTMVMVINMLVPLTCAGYDEQCGWESYGNALPISRTKTVISRYLMEIIITLATILIVAVSQIIFVFTNKTTMPLPYYIAMIAITSLINAIMNPILYKFGVQKSRFVMMAIFLVPSILAVAIMSLMPTQSEEALEAFFTSLEQIPAETIAPIALLISAVIYVLSIFLSISIYKKKDL